MLSLLLASQILSWVVILVMGVALLALARQVGVLHVRVAPAGALVTSKGPSVGEQVPVLEVSTMEGTAMAIGRNLPKGHTQLLLFVSAHCPLCKELIPIAKSFVKRERLDIVFVGDDDVEVQEGLIARMGLAGFAFVNSAIVGRSFHVDRLPYAVLISDSGQLLSKGLVNSREHLESLVTAHELGVVSVQQYLANSKTKVA